LKTVDAVRHFGSKKAVAEALSVSYQAVAKWPKYVPERSAYRLQHLTKGVLTIISSVYDKQRKARK